MKLIYTNSKGESITFDTIPPFFLIKASGVDGIKSILNTQKSPYQDGNTLLNKSLDVREISLEGQIWANNQEELNSYRRQLLKIINPKLSGELTYIYKNESKKIKCEVENSPIFSEDSTSNVQKFIITLICNSPFWTDITESKQEIAGWQGKFIFPIEFSNTMELGAKLQNVIININNTGDVETGMRVIFKALASINNPKVINIKTGEFIKIKKSMVEGDIIEVITDFAKKSVKFNGNNAFNLIDLDSTFFQLSTGDNLLQYSADLNANNLEVYVYYTPKYLGV